MKFCAYCMCEFEGRGRCCSKGCARRVSSQLAATNSGRRRALQRIERRQQDTLLGRKRWREIAMGQNVAENLKAIFGVEPPPPQA